MLNRIDMNCDVAIKEMKKLILRNNNLIEGEPILGSRMLERIRNRLSIRGIILRAKVNVAPEALNGRQSHQIKEVLEELVSNVLKHSQAEEVCLDAETLDNEFILEFSDDGQGIQIQKGENCFGLQNIKKTFGLSWGTYEKKLSSRKGSPLPDTYSPDSPLRGRSMKKQQITHIAIVEDMKDVREGIAYYLNLEPTFRVRFSFESAEDFSGKTGSGFIYRCGADGYSASRNVWD